ncbi:MAG: hypothetical protein HWN68_19830 [Desulfobacterales bacterium]|nr:hypothetical protein [Desulfobacterales bacterium]
MDAPSQIKGLRGGVHWYVAQAIPQIDAEIAEKGHLWMDTSYDNGGRELIKGDGDAKTGEA